MTDEKDIGEELLKQNGIEQDILSDDEQERVRLALVRDRARVKRLKWVTGICWAAALATCLAMVRIGFWTRGDFRSIHRIMAPRPLGLILMCTLVAAAVCTASLFIRSRSLNSREIKASLDEISAQLKRLAEKE